MRRYVMLSLPSASCTVCRQSIPKGTDRVYIDGTWRAEKDTVCQMCWIQILTAAGAGILVQTPLAL